MHKKRLLILFLLGFGHITQAQTINFQKDSAHWHNLNDVTIVGQKSKSDHQKIPEIVDSNVYMHERICLSCH